MVRQVGMYLFWTSLNPSSGLLQPSFPVVCLPELQCVHMYLYDGLSKYYVYKYTNMLLALFVHTCIYCFGNILGKTQFEYVWMILYINIYIYIYCNRYSNCMCVRCIHTYRWFSDITVSAGDHREPEPADAAGAEGRRRSAHLGGRLRRTGDVAGISCNTRCQSKLDQENLCTSIIFLSEWVFGLIILKWWNNSRRTAVKMVSRGSGCEGRDVLFLW